jgi:subtilisin family serine protease
VVNLSLGTYADEGDVPALRAALRRWVARRPDVLFAAAAGNDSVKRRFYPAAFAGEREFRDAVMSVGALDTSPRKPDPDAPRADFSNRGRWVKALAPGVHLHSDYPVDVDLVYGEDQTSNNQDRAHFKGLAEWSGTSFATPYAVAEVIRYAATCGLNTPRAAWEYLRSQAPKALFPLDAPCPGEEPKLY